MPITGGADGLTRWEITIAQVLSDAGYAAGMWGKWHLGSDPEQRSPVDFGFDEAVWSPRTADEVMWTMQSYFPGAPVTASPYAGDRQIPLEPQPVYSRTKGSPPEAVVTYDAGWRAGFDRKITDWAVGFMRRARGLGARTGRGDPRRCGLPGLGASGHPGGESGRLARRPGPRHHNGGPGQRAPCHADQAGPAGGSREGLVRTAEAAPDMGWQSRPYLARDLCPNLPAAVARRIARRTATFAEVFTVATAPHLAEMGPDVDAGPVLAVVDAAVNAQLAAHCHPGSDGHRVGQRACAASSRLARSGPLLDPDGSITLC